MNEFDEAIILANKVLARQFLRSRERIQHLQSLIARAADALGPYALGFPDGSDIRALIAELRKAAK
jgi:hypothetical protein